MRDWFLPAASIAVVVYFIFFPNQFCALLDWAATLMRFARLCRHGALRAAAAIAAATCFYRRVASAVARNSAR
jgi:hypothetical protein